VVPKLPVILKRASATRDCIWAAKLQFPEIPENQATTALTNAKLSLFSQLFAQRVELICSEVG